MAGSNLDALLSPESATAAVLWSLAIVEAYGAGSACFYQSFVEKRLDISICEALIIVLFKQALGQTYALSLSHLQEMLLLLEIINFYREPLLNSPQSEKLVR